MGNMSPIKVDPGSTLWYECKIEWYMYIKNKKNVLLFWHHPLIIYSYWSYTDREYEIMLLGWERETNLHGIFEYFMILFLPFCSSWPKVDIFHLKHICLNIWQVTLSGALRRGIQYIYLCKWWCKGLCFDTHLTL